MRKKVIPVFVKMEQNDVKINIDSTSTKTQLNVSIMYPWWNRYTGTSYFKNTCKMQQKAEECKAILKYKTKTSCMSKNSSKV